MSDLEDRVDAARRCCTAKLHREFADARLSYPAQTVLFRAFKHERLLELWVTNDPGPLAEHRLVGVYPILGASGELGPKRQEGDRQVPEGFYRVTRFNPQSRFHLSLGLDYPNASDLRLTTDPQAPGSDIFIHGGTESKGCLAMGDAALELLYLVARDAEEVHVHLFPCRMDASTEQLLASFVAIAPELESFWQSLRAGCQRFEQTKHLPVIRVDEAGRYLCED